MLESKVQSAYSHDDKKVILGENVCEIIHGW